MRKNKIYFVFSILILIFIFSFAALNNQCKATAEEEEEAEEEIEEEEEAEEAEEGVGEEEEKEEPTIELRIYEGPTYADGICYWRVQANVTGNPTPDVEFSKDDSGGAWGAKNAQVNLRDPSETYTLVAIATNSEGTDTDSIILSWECEEEPPGGRGGGDGDEEDGLDFELPEWEGREIIDYPEMILHPFDIGYVVYPTGVNTSELIIGDSISNTDVRGFFSFYLGDLRGKEIISASLYLNTYKYYPDPSFKGVICITFKNYLPLDAGDYTWPSGLHIISPFDNNENPIEFYLMTQAVQRIVDGSCILGFIIKYENQDTDWDHEIDGREYSKESIRLTVRYLD